MADENFAGTLARKAAAAAKATSRHLPCNAWLKTYDRQTFESDAIAAVIVTINLSNWKLKRSLGYIFIGLYFLFVVEALLLEKGVL